uniref:DbpA RNA binding domain-containing protein n=1 Tax=Winogradskyella sp. TaxID=1883156 RepID=UPI003F6C9E1F
LKDFLKEVLELGRDDVFKVDVKDSFSFFNTEKEHKEKVLEFFTDFKHNGRFVNVEVSENRGRSGGGRRDRGRGRSDRRSGGGNRGRNDKPRGDRSSSGSGNRSDRRRRSDDSGGDRRSSSGENRSRKRSAETSNSVSDRPRRSRRK